MFPEVEFKFGAPSKPSATKKKVQYGLLNMLVNNQVSHEAQYATAGQFAFFNGRRALAEYPEVARVESQAVCPCTCCRQYFLGTSFEFEDLATH